MQEIYVPALGMASDGVYLAEWLKQPGDVVRAGEIIASIETDKAELDVEATAAGTLGRHRFGAGSDVPSGATIAVILADGEAEEADALVSDAPAAAPAAESASVAVAADQPAAATAPASSTGPLTRGDRVRDPQSGELEPYVVSPRARRDALAASNASAGSTPAAPTLLPEVATPSAPVPAASAAVPAPSAAVPAASATAADDRGGVDRHRAAVAAAVARSWAEIPHFSVQRELRVERFMELHRSLRALRNDLTLTDVLLKAYAMSLMEHFATREIDLGLAVATARGVSIPVIRDVARADVLEIGDRRRAAVERALAGRFAEDDVVVPHSTISNLGAYGIDSFTAIVPIGQTSILSVGAAADRPVIEEGGLAVGTTMIATLNVDHREWDGQHAAEVLKRLAAIIAEPLLLGALGK